MSMGIPGLFEPFGYEGHVYCDGGMINDFPMNALPADTTRLGLCVKQKAYVQYHLPQVDALVDGAHALEGAPCVRSELEGMGDELWKRGVYRTRDLADFSATCVNIMMDANLDLQIERVQNGPEPVPASSGFGTRLGSFQGLRQSLLTPAVDYLTSPATAPAAEAEEPPSPHASGSKRLDESKRSIFNLAPQILTLCSGGLQPFDFALRPGQHHELYLMGQLFTHLHATQLGRDDGRKPRAVMSDEQVLKTLLLMLHLDPY